MFLVAFCFNSRIFIIGLPVFGEFGYVEVNFFFKDFPVLKDLLHSSVHISGSNIKTAHKSRS